MEGCTFSLHQKLILMNKHHSRPVLTPCYLQVFSESHSGQDTYPTTTITVTVLPTVPTIPTIPTRSGGSNGIYEPIPSDNP